MRSRSAVWVVVAAACGCDDGATIRVEADGGDDVAVSTVDGDDSAAPLEIEDRSRSCDLDDEVLHRSIFCGNADGGCGPRPTLTDFDQNRRRDGLIAITYNDEVQNVVDISARCANHEVIHEPLRRPECLFRSSCM